MQSAKRKTTTQKLKYFKFLVVLFSFSFLALNLAPAAQAVDIPGWPLVPCGLNQDRAETLDIDESQPCGRCDLFQLLKNIIDFVMGGLMPPLAVLLFVWAGFLILLSGANPGLYAQGQTIFKNTFYGIIVLLSACMITNTLILSVGSNYNTAGNWWQFTCTEPAPVTPPPIPTPIPTPTASVTPTPTGSVTPTPSQGPLIITTSSLPGGTVNQSYSQQVDASGGTGTYSWSVSSGTLPAGLSINFANGRISGTPTTAGTSTFTVRVTDNSTPQQSATKQLSIVVSSSTLTCGQPWEQNLCQPRQMTCSASACSQYTSAINQYAERTGVANGANFLKAIMIKESACNVGAQSGSVPPSCGLMQLKASTANIYKSRCGVPSNVDITCDWLKQSANTNASICIAAEYMGALTQTSCGSTPRGVSAGYNGGSGACQQSSDCSGQTNCAGGPVQRWECLYDNPQQNVCNTGYAETRDYATKVLYCYNNLGF